MYKVTNYGDKLMALQTSESGRKWLSIHSVIDNKKPLKNWEILTKIEQKEINDDFYNKFIKLWEQTGKVEMNIPLFDLIK
jgi:hypothetical protein